ncbi:MCE family protein [Dactylosporangium matsuzakiense]|uniref:ABC transporter substrate-binding protein n=1 Tax=Dactylosporangium matsuzakiense TaxID=53360 RepID=A0A9W6KSN4_9ACTN|nr:MCE family protein [Dactylosporangium matsuzakiense]UWZ46992.1 MCE family protein [Dactylosporangium matsuzakiense]GLL06893.1 ABC transporter substrate-binding protein [Dactylosporangium matsuzakiense]
MTRDLLKLSVFAAVTIALTALLAQALGGFSGGGTQYRARFTDVTGLLAGDDVRIAGVKVGTVRDIRVADNRIAEVAFTVGEEIPLAASVHATIRYRNLVGQRYVALTEGPGDGRPLRPGQTIPVAQTTPALDLTVLFNGFRPLFTALTPQAVNQLAYEIIQVLQGEGGTVAGLLRSTASLTGTLADRDAVIGRVITNLLNVLSTVDEHRDDLDTTITRLQQFVSGLAADKDAIGDALTNTAALTGATASLLQDARPSLQADIDRLGTLSGTLDDNAAVIDKTLQNLPGRYADLTRVASYGSWFNFYLCDFDGQVTLAGQKLTPASFTSTAARCNPGGAA